MRFQRYVVVMQLVLVGAVSGAEDTKARVEDYASKAYELVNKGQYNDAVGLYMKAYQLSPTPALLFNIATIYDKRLQERELAADYYRRYLKAVDADPELAKRAAARLEAIKEELARVEVKSVPEVAPAAAPAPTKPPVADVSTVVSPEPPSSMSGVRVAGIAVAAIGVAALGVGFGFGANAKSLNANALAYCTGKTCWDQRGVELTNQAKNSATIANIGVAAGSAALVAGVLMALLADGAPPSPSTSAWLVGPTFGQGSAGVFLRGDL